MCAGNGYALKVSAGAEERVKNGIRERSQVTLLPTETTGLGVKLYIRKARPQNTHTGSYHEACWSSEAAGHACSTVPVTAFPHISSLTPRPPGHRRANSLAGKQRCVGYSVVDGFTLQVSPLGGWSHCIQSKCQSFTVRHQQRSFCLLE